MNIFRKDFIDPDEKFRKEYCDEEDIEIEEGIIGVMADDGDLSEDSWAGQDGIDESSSGDDINQLDINQLLDDDTDMSDSDTTVQVEGTGRMQGQENGEHQSRIIDDYDEDAEEDEVLRAIIAEIKKPRSKPPNIKVKDFVTDISFHTSSDIIAIGTVTGDILIYQYSNEENTLLKSLEVHSKACRTVEFTVDGSSIISSSRDKSIMITDVETSKLKRFLDDAHTDPVYSMLVMDENLFATGDDEGTVKLWDIRERSTDPIFSLKEVEDHISCLVTTDAKKYLLATSGDGFLTTFSIPGKRMYVQSEPYPDELTSMGVFRNGSKLIVSSAKGDFYAFNWGQFGYHCDAFTIPLSPVSKMIPITERIAITGGEEGILRATHMVPGRVLGVVGQHGLAIEALDINHTGDLIASSSHDNDIRFWNIKYFEEFNDIKYNEKSNTKKALNHNLPSSSHANRADFFADLA